MDTKLVTILPYLQCSKSIHLSLFTQEYSYHTCDGYIEMTYLHLYQ